MGVYYRDKDGNEALVAGMGRSGELVPSVSYYQKGSGQAGSVTAGGYKDVKVTLNPAMPDTDYVIVPLIATGGDKFTVSNVYAQTTTDFIMRIHNYSDTTSDTGYTWKAFKLMTDESRALDESQIAENTADIATLQSNKADCDFPTSSATTKLVSAGIYHADNGAFYIRGTDAQGVKYQFQCADTGEMKYLKNVDGSTWTTVNTTAVKTITSEEQLRALPAGCHAITVSGDVTLNSASNITLYDYNRGFAVVVGSGSSVRIVVLTIAITGNAWRYVYSKLSAESAASWKGGLVQNSDAYTYGTGTIASAGATSGTCEWWQFGRLVTVRINRVRFTDTVSNATCFTGLPAPAQVMQFTIVGSTARSGAVTPSAFLLNVTTDGSITKGGVTQVTSADGLCYGSCTYLTEA